MQSTTGRTDAYASATEWLTSDEAALYLKIERRTLLQWVRQGKVRAYILSGTQRHVWRFKTSDLDAMLSVPAVLSIDGRIKREEYCTLLKVFYSTRDEVLGDSCNGWTAGDDHKHSARSRNCRPKQQRGRQ